MTSSAGDDVGLFDFRRRRTNCEHEGETLNLSVRCEAAGSLWTEESASSNIASKISQFKPNT